MSVWQRHDSRWRRLCSRLRPERQVRWAFQPGTPCPERRSRVRHALPHQHVTDCFLVYAFNPRLQAPQRGRPMRRIRRAGKTGRAWPQPADGPGPTGIPGTGNGRARTGAVCAGTAHGWAPLATPVAGRRSPGRELIQIEYARVQRTGDPVLGMILGRRRHHCGGKATSSLGTTRVREAMACRTSATGT